jgi:hypothetical protein
MCPQTMSSSSTCHWTTHFTASPLCSAQAVFGLQALSLVALLGLVYTVAGGRISAAAMGLVFVAFNFEEVLLKLRKNGCSPFALPPASHTHTHAHPPLW